MLCLMTLVDIDAVSPHDADAVERRAALAALCRHLQPPDARLRRRADSEGSGRPGGRDRRPARRHHRAGAVAFLEGLPRRYLALFGLATIYRHVRLARDIQPRRGHASLEKHDDIWELTVATLDKPFLFSNISGVLSYFGMDIHRGQAMTTPAGLVLDVFEFSDEEEFLGRTPARRGNHPHARARRRRHGRRRGAAARPRAQRALPPPAARAAAAALRQRALAEVHRPRNRRRRRPGPAAPHQPGGIASKAATWTSR